MKCQLGSILYTNTIRQNEMKCTFGYLELYFFSRPVKLNMDFHTNMEMLGRRFPYRADYTVGRK